ncbi:MAG: DUF120 domain-containing protein [Euryarchaeota archaeon]|nr:DUF120 domain-containing protein [Euryarchaeota archaeon]MDE1835005.1 DUF120 domain-containing protein [Euryarchaeota archaeon]MDE1882179.1 DUF120 domain-containing protein [Euryarchaeota archaeon]MDE2044844.1 DUF120 domain-containing protein [Thermoplasmata archaeon]
MSALSREAFGVLKLLASRGASEAPVFLSSRELGEAIGASQQAASQYLIALTQQGLLTRSLSGRKQGLSLTPAGAQVLRKELEELKSIVEGPSPLELTGGVVSGLGEGRYYLSIGGYVSQFRSRLGYKPFPGTLNVKLTPEGLARLGKVRSLAGVRIDGFTDQGRTFGGANCYPSKLNGRPCHLIVPDRTHYSDVAEFIAAVELRRALRLKDGDTVEMVVGDGTRPTGRRS